MNLHIGFGHGLVQDRNATRHGAGVPMLEHPAGVQPEGKIGVRGFGRGLVGPQPDPGPFVGLAVKIIVVTFGCRVVGGIVAPARFLANLQEEIYRKKEGNICRPPSRSANSYCAASSFQ